MEHWHFFCATFGCKVNQYETQALREAWTRAGGIETGDASTADVLLVNSCAITARGERDARNALVRLRREAPGALLVLTGCAARLVADFVPRRGAPRPEADLIVPPERKEELAKPAFADWLARRLDARTKGGALPESPFAGHPGPLPRMAPGERGEVEGLGGAALSDDLQHALGAAGQNPVAGHRPERHGRDADGRVDEAAAFEAQVVEVVIDAAVHELEGRLAV
ncbi:MAG: hypothetical protein IIY31_05335, partial [Desulfovibrio sp.]|nr:hypothetical protein [Desulfovibrio sp.]